VLKKEAPVEAYEERAAVLTGRLGRSAEQ